MPQVEDLQGNIGWLEEHVAEHTKLLKARQQRRLEARDQAVTGTAPRSEGVHPSWAARR